MVSVIATFRLSVKRCCGHMAICRNRRRRSSSDKVFAIATRRYHRFLIKDVFSRKVTNSRHAELHGRAWLEMFVTKADSMDCTVGNVTFAPGVRNGWHSHPGGQILLLHLRRGRYQEENPYGRCGPATRGESPRTVHWQAAPDSSAPFAYRSRSAAVEGRCRLARGDGRRLRQ